MNVGELAAWIMKNKRGKAFASYSMDKLVQLINHAIDEEVFLTAHDENGNLCGVVCGTRYDEKKSVHIHDILTTKPWVIKTFMEYFISKYPTYILEGTVRGRYRVFNNAEKLYKRL